MCPRVQKPWSAVYTQKTTKNGVQVSGAELQALTVDTRTAVWVSTAERTSETFSKVWGGLSASSAPAELPGTFPIPGVSLVFFWERKKPTDNKTHE